MILPNIKDAIREGRRLLTGAKLRKLECSLTKEVPKVLKEHGWDRTIPAAMVITSMEAKCGPLRGAWWAFHGKWRRSHFQGQYNVG